MKILKLKKGEPSYISIPEGSILSIEYTNIIKNGWKLVLVRVV